jgi:serine/threonine protein kinase
MEYIEGTNLLQFIKGNHNKPLSIELALDIMRPIMQAVALLHKHKLTHLDIKHENVILSKESDGSYRPVLIDFGQAKHYDKKGNATSELTNAGCSDGFAPPEQYLGLSQFTPQADVYALCATLLYLLTAKQPVKSSDINASLITDMLPADTPSYITTAIINGMRRDKDDRIQSVESLADSLRINLSEIDDNVNSTIKLHIENKHKRNNLLKLNNPLMWFFAICLISAIGGIIWYSNSFHSSQDDNSSHSSRDELFDYNNPSIHYSKDILDKCQDIAFYEHTREDDVYHFNSFYEHTHHFNFYVEDGGFMFYGLDSLDTIRFE